MSGRFGGSPLTACSDGGLAVCAAHGARAGVEAAVERARALAYFAALTIVESDERRPLAVAMAKAAAGECQRIAFQNGLQLFGAMGFTWENDLQFALRRAKFGALMFGPASEHRRRVAREALAR